jgi:hypothetical protein
MMEDILFGWLVGLVLSLLLMACDTYRVCDAPVRPERSRHEA